MTKERVRVSINNLGDQILEWNGEKLEQCLSTNDVNRILSQISIHFIGQIHLIVRRTISNENHSAIRLCQGKETIN